MADKTIEPVKVGDLHWPRYQREPRPGHISTLTRKWNDELVGVLHTSSRDGRLWVVDGWHRRMIAFEMHGADYELWCEIHNWTEEVEQESWEQLNGLTLRTSSLDIFMSRLSIGGADELAMQATAKHHGLEISRSNSSNSIRAPRTLYEIYNLENGPELLNRIFSIPVGAYGPEGGAGHNLMLSGLRALLLVYPNVDDRRLMRRLGETGTVYTLIGQARGHGGGGHSGAVSTANAIIEIYNVKLKANRLLPIVQGATGKRRFKEIEGETA